MQTWKIIALAAVALVGVVLLTTSVFASMTRPAANPYGTYNSYGSYGSPQGMRGGMMGGRMGNGYSPYGGYSAYPQQTPYGQQYGGYSGCPMRNR